MGSPARAPLEPDTYVAPTTRSQVSRDSGENTGVQSSLPGLESPRARHSLAACVLGVVMPDDREAHLVCGGEIGLEWPSSRRALGRVSPTEKA